MTETPAAIVGMAVVLPGADDLAGYWDNLVNGVDAIVDVPEHRWDRIFYRPADGSPVPPDVVYCHRGGFVDSSAFVDTTSFGIPPVSVSGTEPDQLIALHVAAAAVADAGGPDRLPDRDRVGVILGKGGYVAPAGLKFNQRVRGVHQLSKTLGELLPQLDDEALELIRRTYIEGLGTFRPESAIGLVSNLAASRIANRLDLRGPSYTVDGACASSLLAVDHAVRELASGRCDMVLAGGLHHTHDISFWSVFAQLQALSTSEVIRPFDSRADGTLIGEGTAVMVLKRLADAQRDGDRVYAVVRGVGVSSDGRGTSLVNPDSGGQVRAVAAAWRAAGLDPAVPGAIGLLEAHGTATPAGDTAELTTINSVFGGSQTGPAPVLGSVKSMIGHTMPAAGAAGMVKTALALYHRVQLPTLHCEHPHPLLAESGFRVLDEARDWQPGPVGIRRAGVNAFGFGGVNAHVVLEEAPGAGHPVPPRPLGRSPRAVRLDLGGALVSLKPATLAALRASLAVGVPTAEISPLPAPQSTEDGGWRAQLTVSTQNLPYLRDHCFFHQRPDWPDEADRWPVMPATTMMHIVLDLAEHAAGGSRVTSLRDVKFHQWLSAAPATEVTVLARPAGKSQVDVSLGEHARMVAGLAPDYPRPPEPWPADPDEKPVERDAQTLYTGRLMFHGPGFQGITRLTGMSDHHVRGQITAPAAPGALLDNCGQLLGFWVISHYTERSRVLPTGLDMMELFGPHPAPGTLVDCVVRINSVDSTWVTADIELTVDGRVWARMAGWRDRRFDNDPTTQLSETFPEYNTLSQPHPGGWVVLHERWDDLATRMLVVRNQLGTPERAAYESAPPRQRRHWLLRRVAAKDAVRRWLWDQGEGPIFPAEIELREQDGRLVAIGRHSREVPQLDISVAVTADTAVAAVRAAGSARPPGVAIATLDEHQDEGVVAHELVRQAAAVAHRADPAAAEVVAADGDTRAVAVPDSGRRRTRHVQTAVLPAVTGLVAEPRLVAWT
ncbi:hypothetical protein DMH04_10760 [Kibdelosporangium aridum]|uniref:Ketosynthase family 3 (KS3) domain-containing protein n=1 Tax=Kibdelosporangium aridum TaxID=2030 RepID=A0A428ZHQ9_KIBAR|nr:beta-ketoacyl synthase N-terminal-like domain-containing protein [Kibdelosporangium aridum]RSM87607.1 hypothetical protein DMH04_10760 [Kibdelosporangium aridum]